MMMSESPPFSSHSPQLSPTITRRGSASSAESFSVPGLHNPLLDLLHAHSGKPHHISTSSHAGGSLPGSPALHAQQTGPGVLRHTHSAPAGLPDLTLPEATTSLDGRPELDAVWPVDVRPPSPNAFSPNLQTSPPLTNYNVRSSSPSPPLVPLFGSPSAFGGLPLAGQLLSSGSNSLRRFQSARDEHRAFNDSHASPSGYSSESSGDGNISPAPMFAPLPGSIIAVENQPPSGTERERDNRGRKIRRRKRSSRSSGSSHSSRNSSLERSDDEPHSAPVNIPGSASSSGLDGTATSSGGSPPQAPREKQPHLAMPERSGWDFPDDDDEEDDEDDADVDASSGESDRSTGSDEDGEGEDTPLDQDARQEPESQLQRWPQKSADPPDRPPIGDSSLQLHRTPAWTPVNDIDAVTVEEPTVEHRQQSAAPDDESLSILERIFLLSKSEYREQRTAVTRALPDWLEKVDICEAVEYILPLLNGIAADGVSSPHSSARMLRSGLQMTTSRLH